ncbi:hypothetical protein [Sporomusa sphaeroides]|nr:hypothetical protein [Sporomusa sphaeroides]
MELYLLDGEWVDRETFIRICECTPEEARQMQLEWDAECQG